MNSKQIKFFLGAITLVPLFGLNSFADYAIDPAREAKSIKTVQSDASLYDKAMACQELAKIATSKSVDALSSLLCDKSLKEYIRYGIAGVKDPKVDKALRMALSRCDDRMIKIGIINSIGVRRDTGASSQLANLALDPKSGVAPQALAALGNILDKTSIDTLLKSLKCKNDTLRLAGGNAAINGAGRLFERKRAKDAVVLYEALAQADLPEYMHTMALFGEILAKGPDGVALLIENLKSKNSALRGAALRASYYIESEETAKILARELGNLDPDTQVLVIKAFAARKNRAAIAAVVKMTESKEPAVASEAFRTLGIIGDQTVTPLLVNTAISSSPYSKIALNSLLILKGDAVDKAILSAAKKSDGKERADLIGLLTSREAKVDMDEFFVWGQDDDVKVAKAAVRAIGILAPAKSLDRAVLLLKGLKKPIVRNSAEEAVIALTKKIEKVSDRTGAIAKFLAQEKESNNRCSFVRILARVGGTDSFNILKKLITDRDAEVADAAVRGICSWRDMEALDTLYGIVMKDASATHRILAARQYSSLITENKSISASEKAKKLSVLLSQNKDVSGKKAILIALGFVADPGALDVVAGCFADAQLREEAQAAALQICGAIAGALPEQVKRVIEQIKTAPANDDIRQQAIMLKKALAKKSDFITAWQISPIYKKAGSSYRELFDVQFAPEMGKDVDWRLFPAGILSDKAWMIDLKQFYIEKDAVAYFKTWIYVPENRKGLFEFGSDDGIKAWLNGTLFHTNNAARAAIPGSDKASADLVKGWNRLLLKITQNNGGWQFCARLRDPSGAAMKDVKVDCLHEEKFVPLFDGKTFNGLEGDRNVFRIEDGAIVCGKLNEKLPHNYFLSTTKQYGDFEIRLQIKTSSPRINAGVQFRSKKIPNSHELIGYQGEVRFKTWGALYDESRRNRFLTPINQKAQKAIREKDWNDYVIRCEGMHVCIFVNGIQTVDYVEKDPACIQKTGIIGFQIHGGQKGEARYRNIMIKEL